MIRAPSIIIRIENHRSKAKDLSSRDLSNYLVFNSLAMECFQAVNSAIDLAELIVAEKNLGFPSKYKEIFELLNKAKLINTKTLDSMKRLVFLRNLISHEYYTITQKELKEMADLLRSLDELIKAGKSL
ncbi:MAG TPA: HepT-like ribonuclease domain-containing protein [archaeon]|nr:HepT-like ribonuclease domain-containing protein [archaeon]